MHPLLVAGADALLFVLLPWILWRMVGRSIPLAVLPILIGLGLAWADILPASLGVPSEIGSTVGFVGVLILAFSAGLEMRHTPEDASGKVAEDLNPSVGRLLLSAGVALALPFAVGTMAAQYFLQEMPEWLSPKGHGWLGAMAIGLCVAVSALPVLVGVVRELGPAHRSLGKVALSVAVIDDAVLWIGLAALIFVANGGVAAGSLDGTAALALVALAALLGLGFAAKRLPTPPARVIWLLLPAYLAVGAWSSAQLGLHALLGAYFAGAVIPPAWVRRIPVERLGMFALLGLAPLFFGHSGLRIDGNALSSTALVASIGLLGLSFASKLVAVLLYPPAKFESLRDTLAVGSLLQGKGLMEIVAATILLDQQLISTHAYAALVTLAVMSTALTGPVFHLFRSKTRRADSAYESP